MTQALSESARRSSELQRITKWGFLGGIFLLMVGQHFQLLAISGFPVTVGLVAGVVSFLLLVRRPNLFILLTFSYFATTVALLALILRPSEVSLIEFGRTLSLVLLAATFLAYAMGDLRQLATKREIASVLYAALIAVVATSLLQVIAGTRGSDRFFNPFGSHQYLYPYNPHLEFNPVPRAQGFYLEPSYDAFIIGSLAVCIVALGHFKKSSVALAFLGMGLTQSAAGITLTLVLIAVFTISSRASTAVVGGAIALIGIIMTENYLSERFASLTTSGSSANFRIVAPLRVISDTLLSAPFGHPLGSISQVLPTYALFNGPTIGVTLDNGFYVIIFYFGWVGVLGIVLLGAVLASESIRAKRLHGGAGWLCLPWIFASMMFSGGVFLPEFAATTGLTLVAFRLSMRTGENEAWNAGIATALDSRGDLPRHLRNSTNPGLARRA